jgi:hypothetical protein
MSLINISDLNPAGSDLFATTDSFMTELQEAEATAIYGGKSNKGGGSSVFIFGGYGGGYGGGYYGGGYGGGYGRGYGRGRGGRGYGGYGGGYYC